MSIHQLAQQASQAELLPSPVEDMSTFADGYQLGETLVRMQRQSPWQPMGPEEFTARELGIAVGAAHLATHRVATPSRIQILLDPDQTWLLTTRRTLTSETVEAGYLTGWEEAREAFADGCLVGLRVVLAFWIRLPAQAPLYQQVRTRLARRRYTTLLRRAVLVVLLICALWVNLLLLGFSWDPHDNGAQTWAPATAASASPPLPSVTAPSR